MVNSRTIAAPVGAPAPETDYEAYGLLLRAVRKLDLIVGREADALLERELGMSRGQFLVLDYLAERSGQSLSQSTLAEHLGLTRAAVSRHVIEATAAGLVRMTTAKRSRREVEMRLTAVGRRRVTKGRKVRAAVAAETLTGLQTDQIVAVTGLLNALAERVAAQARR